MSKPNREYLIPTNSPPPVGYSQVVKVNKGTLVYLAGQVPNDASGNLVGEGDFGAQVEQVFRNIKIAIEAAGGTMADLIKINNYIVASVDQAELAKFRVARDRYVNTEKPPASTLVYVSRLARPGWLVEIEAVAAIDS
jgi:enamine deaminase RidA (YjgF/YER057c/UK114 family)